MKLRSCFPWMHSSRAFSWVVTPLGFVYKKTLYSNKQTVPLDIVESFHLNDRTVVWVSFAGKWTLFSNNTKSAIRMYSLRAFILKGHTFRFLIWKSAPVLVKYCTLNRQWKILKHTAHCITCMYFNNTSSPDWFIDWRCVIFCYDATTPSIPLSFFFLLFI